MTWASKEADKRAAHGKACRCIRCVGQSRFVAETQVLKDENDANGAPAVPPGWHAVRRRLRIVGGGDD